MKLNNIEEKKVDSTGIICVDQETGELYVPRDVTEHLALIEQQKKENDAYEKKVREALKMAMEEYGITKIESDYVTVSYVAETETVSFDKKLFEENFPALYASVEDECSKITSRKAHVKINVKGIK